MSVLIKGMEMPKNCWLCPLSVLYDKPREALFCRISKEEVLRYKIDSNCPITEIQSHGRLIDADALMTDAQHKGKYDVVNAYDIANAPTILEADGTEGRKHE